MHFKNRNICCFSERLLLRCSVLSIQKWDICNTFLRCYKRFKIGRLIRIYHSHIPMNKARFSYLFKCLCMRQWIRSFRCQLRIIIPLLLTTTLFRRIKYLLSLCRIHEAFVKTFNKYRLINGCRWVNFLRKLMSVY